MEGGRHPGTLSPLRRQLLTPARLKAGLRGTWIENDVNSSSGSGGQATVTPQLPSAGPTWDPGPGLGPRELAGKIRAGEEERF